jgi:Secretion system C-terminal sorting domain
MTWAHLATFAPTISIFMRTYATLSLAILAIGYAHGQNITNVTISPPNPNSCQLFSITISGTLPSTGQTGGISPSLPPDTIQISLSASGGNGGNSNFSVTQPGFGPFLAGNYVLYVPLLYNGVVADYYSTTLVIPQGVNPNAGLYGDTTVCSSAANFPLISVLDGDPDPGGVWTDQANTVITNGIFDPGTSLEGFYSYTFDVQAPCTDASQSILISYSPNNSAGTNGTLQVCAAGGGSVGLFASLGGTPTAGGTWTKPGGQAHSGTYIPGTDPCGVYTYTVPGIVPCSSVSATVNVQCVQPPNAGVDTQLLVCFDDVVENLNTTLQGEQAGGSWLDPAGFSIGGFNANINLSLYGSGTYHYVVPGTICPSDTSSVVVTLSGPPCTLGIGTIEGLFSRFELAPNPAADRVVLEMELTHASKDHVLELLDVHGRVVRREGLNFVGLTLRKEIDLSGLTTGAYLVRVSSADGNAVRRLLVK